MLPNKLVAFFFALIFAAEQVLVRVLAALGIAQTGLALRSLAQDLRCN